MRTQILLILSLLISTLANAQWWGDKKMEGNGNQVTQERQVGEYDEVAVAGSFNVILVAGTEGNIQVSAEENLQEYIITEVKGNKLKIYIKDGYSLESSRNKAPMISVPFRTIERVSLAGSGDVVTKNEIAAQHFECSLSGSGDLILEVNVQHIEASVAGSGDLSLKGSAQKTNLKVAGSGDLDASALKSIEANASIAGSGDISLNCEGGNLKAHIAGSGDIHYTGKPSKINSNIVGSGSISN